MHRILVIGGNFAGFTAAFELKRKLGETCKVTIISKSPSFLFIPSLIWVPFGKRDISSISLPLKPIANKANVEFVCDEAIEVLPKDKVVKGNLKEYPYDYLVIATGQEWIFNQLEGMGLDSNISFIVNPETTWKTRQRLNIFAKNPGPVVIGATPGAQCFGPAYEFLFNFEKWCRQNGIRNKVDITFVTPEPFLGHLGIGGVKGSKFLLKNLLPMYHINYITNASIEKVTNESIFLNNRRSIPYQFSMLMPIFHGVKAMKNSPILSDELGFVPVNDGYQHKSYPDIFSVGVAADYPVKFKTPVPIGMSKTGYASVATAKIAVENITRLLNGNYDLKLKPRSKINELCILDASEKEIIAFSAPILKPRKFSLALPNPIYDFSKLMVEKYYMWKVRNGYSWLI